MPHHDLYRRLIRCVLTMLIAIPWSALAVPLPARADDAPPASPVFIEEVAWAGSAASIADEWIELANLGPATTTIAGWSLTGAGVMRIFLPEDAAIGPGGTYRIANYAETDDKSALAVPVQVATTTIALSNSALGIQLLDANGTLIDQAGDGRLPLSGSSSPRATMVRATTSSGDIADAWMTAQLSVGFKNSPADGIGTATDFGAPGICELCLEMNVATATSPELPDTGQDITYQDATSSDAFAAATSTDTSTSIVATSSASSINTSSQIVSQIPSVIPALHYSLNETVSNPAAGPEWVELKIAETGATSTDRALELWDKTGRFMTIPAHTAVTAPGYLVLSLVSSRLNNGGDDLSLREVPLNGSSGIVIELVHIPALEDGVAWAKRDGGTWDETKELTPGASNAFPATQAVAVVATNVPPPSVPISATSTATHYIGPSLHVKLNEAMSNPASGKEWIELAIAETSATTTDRAYELWDGSGKMISIPADTPITSPGYVLVTLPTSRLNNSGDALSLRESGGDVTLDATDIPALAKGISWARDETNEWTDCAAPTPGIANKADPPNDTESPINKGNANDSSSGTSTIRMTLNKPTLRAPSTTLTTSMSHDSPVNARVRLIGTVGSVPRLLGATHAFILLGEDGRAAIVYLPSHLNTPNFGSTVRVMGTLTATERQLELRMKTSDVWLTIATSTPPQARTVDYLAPGTEDAWAFVSATGTVKSAGATSAVLDVDAVDVTVSAPAAAGYRTKRLLPGDVVHVIGLLDPRKETPTILIRVPEDITLTAHAPESVNAPPSAPSVAHGVPTGFPDWVPFGAAGGAVAATGGFQRLRAILKRRKLESLAAASR